jgi:hypothetical protein
LLLLLLLLLPLPLPAGSVESLTPGVVITAVDEAAGTITLDIPDATPNVEVHYVAVDASGQLSAPVYVVGTRE